MRLPLKLTVIGLALLPAIAMAAPFDPEAATRTYLDTLGSAARDKSDAYFEGGYWLILWGTVTAVLGELIILTTGLSARFRDWAESKTKRPWVQTWLYTIPYLIVGTLIALPWTIYTQYFREKQYDLLSQGFGAWASEQAIGFALLLLVGPLAIAGIFRLIVRSPKKWWLWGAGASTIFVAVSAMIFPLFVAPLFNSYTEMKAGPLRERIVAMAKANDVPAEHIYVVNASKQSKRISANVSGLGPTIRISLNDNLLNRGTPDEVAAVMGHELGHYVLGHVAKSIIVFSLIFVVMFAMLYWLTPRIVARYGARWGIRSISDPAVIPIYSILIALFFFCATPLINTLIRVHESEADAFALESAREPDAQSRAFLKLAEYRKMQPGPIEEMLFFDHPSGQTRIRMAMAWKAKHLAEVEARGK
jgi:STE24 endopeptidase